MEKLNVVKEFVLKYKTYIIICVILVISAIAIIVQNNEDKSTIYINDNEIVSNKYDGKIAVYITGEVVNPGVYYIDENLRLNDLIEVCGGLKSDADLSEINLAEKLNDSDKIDIPKKLEKSESIEESEYEESESGLVNINTATKEELKSLNGIGDTLANNIIEYRKSNKFSSIEDILNVNGIGDSKFENIKEYICVN